MRSDLAIMIHKVIGNIQKEMEKTSKTSWGVNLEDNDCLFTVYFLNSQDEVSSNEKVLRELAKLNKFFMVKRTIVGSCVTVYLEVREKYKE